MPKNANRESVVNVGVSQEVVVVTEDSVHQRACTGQGVEETIPACQSDHQRVVIPEEEDSRGVVVVVVVVLVVMMMVVMMVVVVVVIKIQRETFPLVQKRQVPCMTWEL
jgi:hypothetical protein